MLGAILHISAMQSILIGVIAGLALVSWIYTLVYGMRALIMSAMVGAILHHAQAGLEFGAAAELIYLGLINAAGVVPPSPLGPGIFGVIIYVSEPGMSIGAAIAYSLPFAIFIQFINTIIFTIVSPFGKFGETLIRKERFKLYRLFGQSTAILLFIEGLILGYIGAYSHTALDNLIKKIPSWLQSGLGVGGAMLPAMGFAVVLRLMLKKEYLPFLLIGYTLVIIFTAVGASQPQWGYSLIAIAIAAAAVAFVVFNSGLLAKQESRRRVNAPVSGGEQDGI